jgi:hypothetical protein
MPENPHRKSRLRALWDRVRRWAKRERDLPGDPYAYRMAPVSRGPKGRSGSAAVAEREEEDRNFFRSQS